MFRGISNLNIDKIYWIRTDFALDVESINPSDLPKCKYFSHYTPINQPQVYKRYPPVEIKTGMAAENIVYLKVWLGSAVTATVRGTHFALRSIRKTKYVFDFWFVSVVMNNNCVLKV